jgi:hypothetical protein
MKIPPNDFALGMLATTVQMEAIARGKPVIDLSDPKELARLQEAAQNHQQRQAENLKKGVFDPRSFYLPAN